MTATGDRDTPPTLNVDIERTTKRFPGRFSSSTLPDLFLHCTCNLLGFRMAGRRVTSRNRYIPVYPILICLIAASITTVSAAANFTKCLEDVRAGQWGTVGGRNNLGEPVDVANATALSYDLCVKACGTDPEPFDWSSFSQQFGAWLLPWLALVSNLPFGASIRGDNLLSVILAVGSPTLAVYSLALTVLNGQWITMRFRGLRYPNASLAVQVLRNLQQVPLKIYTDNCLLASLVVLPQNDHWWADLAERLDYTYTWSISSATSIAWVIIAYVFTLIDSFTNIGDHFNSTGQGVGSAWLWLLPVVAGWLIISPKSDYGRVYRALRRANKSAYVATPAGVIQAGKVSQKFAFSIQHCHDSPVFRANECSPPVFNYARFLPWVEAVEEVHSAFQAAARKAHVHKPVNRPHPWVYHANNDIDPENRKGSMNQIARYCTPSGNRRKSRFGPDVFSRVFVAGFIGVGVQWGTTGAAVIVQYFTPTRGLGCRSTSYLLYASVSTVICGMLVVSSFLAHYSTIGEYLSIEDSFVMNTYSPSEGRSPHTEPTLLPDASSPSSASPFPAEPFSPWKDSLRPGSALSQPESSSSMKGKHQRDYSEVDTPSTSRTRIAFPLSPNEEQQSKEKGLLLGESPVPAIVHDDFDIADEVNEPLPSTERFAARLSVILRRVAYLLAILNSIWLICVCFFQLCSFWSRCYCDSSYIGLRSRAYAVFMPDSHDIAIMKRAWLAGVGLGTGSCLVFFGFVWLYINPPHIQID